MEAQSLQYIYPTPVYLTTFSDEEQKLVHDEMQPVVESIEWVTPDTWGKTHMLSTKNFEEDSIQNYNLNNFNMLFQRELSKYCNQLEFNPPPYRSVSWFTRFDKGDYGHRHVHPRADISGVYYYKTNGKDGNLYFECPSLAAENSMCYPKYTSALGIEPKVGMLILFPAWLPHGIRCNTTDNTRISFAFNITFAR